MARDTGHVDKSRVSLQLEADRTEHKKRPSFVTYLAVLFAGAFILLLISYMMELRNQVGREEVLPAMTMEEKNSILEENVMLKAENEEIRDQMTRLEERIAQLEQTVSGMEETISGMAAQQEEAQPPAAEEEAVSE